MNYKDIQNLILTKTDANLSEFACKNSAAVRKNELTDDIRLPFAIDRDRIIYSGPYRRLSGKTQVMYFATMQDEQITNRLLHIQYVSQIARTIGAALGLNLDLLEAAALGHDLGHPPFGHDGERFLSKECEKYGIGKFHHNLHSLYIIDEFSYRGRGMNLTFQVRDAIVSHNGEIHQTRLAPDRSKTEAGLEDYRDKMRNAVSVQITPATLEGCVIRFCDTLAYIGTDIEDAIRLNLITREDLPADVVEILGNNNGKIVGALVKDIIETSYGQDYISFSEEVSHALKKLKSFNYERIYFHPKLKQQQKKIGYAFPVLFDTYLEDLKNHNRESNIFNHFLDSKREEYLTKASNAEKVRDFLASMTDRYFKNQLEKITIPYSEI